MKSLLFIFYCLTRIPTSVIPLSKLSDIQCLTLKRAQELPSGVKEVVKGVVNWNIPTKPSPDEYPAALNKEHFIVSIFQVAESSTLCCTNNHKS